MHAAAERKICRRVAGLLVDAHVDAAASALVKAARKGAQR